MARRRKPSRVPSWKREAEHGVPRYLVPGHVDGDGFHVHTVPAPPDLWPSRSLQLCARHAFSADARREALAILQARGMVD